MKDETRMTLPRDMKHDIKNLENLAETMYFEIVKKEPAVQTMVERWPALFTERQVFAEFNRIAIKNLEGDFFEALDQYAPCFIELFKTKKGTVGQKLRGLMQHMSWRIPDVTVLRSVVLKGIPILLGDDSSEFYKTCSDTARDEALECITVGVLTVVSEDCPHEGQSSVDLQPISTAIIHHWREVLSWIILKTCLRQFVCCLGLHMHCIWITQNAWQIHSTSFRL
ncbi:uncharacterized protein LOC125146056 [Tachysurus fulvidraco]|uniref:uncharacterized protein LOC125146056 n=1 Tax=Tachysurus fulvidraco TaxID=1234273 RepID=UPI001FEE4B16|nr:uncharacterized protein LOC125146056 [Tachysurus fulvidraco]